MAAPILTPGQAYGEPVCRPKLQGRPPLAFYLFPPADGECLFTLSDEIKAPRVFDRKKNPILPLDIPTWSPLEIQLEANKIRTKHPHLARLVQWPSSWHYLYKYFDSVDLWTKGAWNLLALLEHLAEENEKADKEAGYVYEDSAKSTNFDVVDDWVWKWCSWEENRDLLSTWDRRTDILNLLNAAHWTSIGPISPEDKDKLRNCLLYWHAMYFSHDPRSLPADYLDNLPQLDRNGDDITGTTPTTAAPAQTVNVTDKSSDAETAVPEPTVSSIANDDASNLAVIPTTDSAAEDGQTTQQAVIIAPRSDIVIVNGSNYKKSVGASALASMRNSASPEARIGHRASKSGPVPTDRSLATQAASIMAPGPSRLPIRHQQPHQSEKHAQRAEKSQAQSPQKSVMATPPMGPSNINMHRGADLIQQRCSNAHKRQSDTEVYLACDCNRCMTASRSIHVRRISSGSSNLSKEQIETILTNYFSTWGHVEAVVAKTKVIDNRRSCYANVRFTSEKSALIAVANANDRPLEPLSKCASVSHPYFSKWFIPAPMRSPFRKFRERNDSTTTRTTWQSSPKTSSPGSSGPRNSWNTPPRGSRGMMPVATPSSARSITVPHQFQGNVPPVHFFAPSGHYSRPVDVPYGPFYHQLPPNLHQMTHGAPPAQAWADMRLQPGFVHSQTPFQPNPSLMGPPRSLPSNQDVMPVVRHIFRQNELTVTEEAVSTVSDSACNERSSYGQTKNGEANDMQTRPSIEDDLANDLYGPKPTKSSSSKPGSAISVRLPSMSPTRASSPANMEPETTSSNENKDIQDGKDDGKAKKSPDLSIYCEGEPVQASTKEESPASPEEDNSDQAIQRNDEAKELPSASATAGQDRSSDGHLNGNNSPKNPSALSRSGSRNSVRYSSRFDVGDIRLEEGFSETVIHRPNRRQNIFAEWMPTGEDGYEHLSDGPNNTNSRPSRNDRRIYQHGNYHRKRKIPFSAAQYRNAAGDNLAATHVSTPPVLAPVPLVNPLNKNKHHHKKSSVSNAGATTNGGAQASTSTIVVTSEFQEQGARRLDQQPCNEQKSSNNAITANNPRTNVNGPTKSKRNKRKAATAAAAAVALTGSVGMNGANGSSTSTNTTAAKANGNTPTTTSTSVTTPAAHGTTAKPTNGTAESPSSESSRAATPAISDSSVTISASPREVPAPTRARSRAGVRASSTAANDTTVPSSVPTVSAQSTTTACTPTSTSSALAPAPPVRVPSYSEVVASGVTKSKNGNNAAVFKGQGEGGEEEERGGLCTSEAIANRVKA